MNKQRTERVLLISEGISPYTGVRWGRNILANLTTTGPEEYPIYYEFSIYNKTNNHNNIIGFVRNLHLGTGGLYGYATFVESVSENLHALEDSGTKIHLDLRAGCLVKVRPDKTLETCSLVEFKLAGISK